MADLSLQNGKCLPRMGDTDYMVNITQSKLEQLVGEYTPCVGESKERMVREDGTKAHGSSVLDCLMTEVA